MRFFETLFAGAALVAAALAVEINEFPSEVQAGRSYRITYTPGDNTPTTFILRKGENDDLDTITTLTGKDTLRLSLKKRNNANNDTRVRDWR